MEFLTALISRLNITGTPIGLKLPGTVGKPRLIKFQQVIPGNKILATRQQMCHFKENSLLKYCLKLY